MSAGQIPRAHTLSSLMMLSWLARDGSSSSSRIVVTIYWIFLLQ